MSDHPDVKEWIAFEKAIGANKPSAFISLSKKLNSERKFIRFHYGLGYDYRHHGGNKDQALGIPHYKALAKRFAKDSTRASNWLEASRYGTEADQVEALRHFLQADAVNDPASWYNAFNAAVKSEDAALLAQTYQYLVKAEVNSGSL